MSVEDGIIEGTCPICAAVVADVELHERWHEEQDER